MTDLFASSGGPPKVILLDLQMTLVANGHERTEEAVQDYHAHISKRERYRDWLVELLRDFQRQGGKVLLLTARKAYYRNTTLESIRRKTAWVPDEAFFNDAGLPAHRFKERVLLDVLFPRGLLPGEMLGLESNGATRAVYARLGIRAEKVPEDHSWTQLPTL